MSDRRRKATDAMVTLIILVNVAVFVTMVLSTGNGDWSALELFDWGGNYGMVSLRGEWWRLLTSTYMHVNILHIVGNMSVLNSAGRPAGRSVRARVGALPFLLVYTACGVAASFASAWFHPSAVSAGSSGAIAGMVAIQVVFCVAERSPEVSGRSLLLLIGINGLLSLVPEVDWVAHLGGFVTGLVLGMALLTWVPRDPPNAQLGMDSAPP